MSPEAHGTGQDGQPTGAAKGIAAPVQAALPGFAARPGAAATWTPPQPSDEERLRAHVRHLVEEAEAEDRGAAQIDDARLALNPSIRSIRWALSPVGEHGPVIPPAWRPSPPAQTPVSSDDERELVFDGRHLFRRGDADETPTAPVEETPDYQFTQRVEGVYEAICRDETGRTDDPEAVEERLEERNTLKAQSHEIARKLIEAGKEAYRNEAWCLWVYHVHTKHLETLPKFRRICLLPYVAAMVRAGHLRALEYWLQRHPHCRFWTFTSGKRCYVEDLRERLNALHRKLSALNAYLKRRGYPVEIVFRSSELGTVEGQRYDENAGCIGRDASGRALYHPHAHCVVWLKQGRLPAWRWTALLSDVWTFWGDNWQDGDEHGGPIRNPRECVKYVFKPGEIAALTSDELSALHDALFRMKLVQPMGELKRELKVRDAAGMTLVKQRTRDGAVWREEKDWNKHLPKDADDRRLAAALRLDSKGVDMCAVVARLVPAIGPLGVSEPRVVVMGTRWDGEAVASHPLVRRIVQHTRERFSASLIRVHTGTPTVTDGPPLAFMSGVEERLAPPGPPIFALA